MSVKANKTAICFITNVLQEMGREKAMQKKKRF